MARTRRIARRSLRQIKFVPAPRRQTGVPQPTPGLIEMSCHGPLYTYEPLSRDFDQMRLLKLQPRCSSAHIEIEITHVPSSAPPAYEALSYVWGSPERTHSVIVKTYSDLLYELAACTLSVEKQQELLQRVQPRHLPISLNLFVALEHLRLLEEPRVLWIDAICINQDDISERSEQVNNMGSIYSNARRVVLWLGEEADESTSAFTSLRSLGEGVNVNFSRHPPQVGSRPGNLAQALQSKLNDPSVIVDLLPSWRPIEKLLERPWFTRLWVIQEMVLATDAIFMIGSALLPYPLFRAAIFWMIYLARSNANFERIPKFELIDQVYMTFACVPGSRLGNLAYLTRKKWCIDPRDKIYAILNLLSPHFSTRIIPDYRRPPEEIFKEVVLHHINWTMDLSLMYQCSFHDPTSNSLLPSWVLNFSGSSQFREHDFNHRASATSKQESVYDSSVNSLQISGRQICIVDKVFQAVPFDAKLPDTLTICKSWEMNLSSAAQQIGRDFDEDAFFATIFSGENASRRISDNNMDFRTVGVHYRAACEQISPKLSSLNNSSWASECVSYLSKSLRGQRLFMSHSGRFGLCPAWTEEGDVIIVALGSDMPLVLRSARQNCYQIGGGCFVNGMMTGEALLGPLSAGIRHDWEEVDGAMELVFIYNDGTVTQLDPRAGPLPPGWTVFYVSKSGEEGPEIVDGEFQNQAFRNSDTGEKVWWDPRVTSENLKKRGVDMQDFVLV